MSFECEKKAAVLRPFDLSRLIEPAGFGLRSRGPAEGVRVRARDKRVSKAAGSLATGYIPVDNTYPKF